MFLYLKKLYILYSDEIKITSSVPTYSYFEIVAEKLRTLVQRNRPRDVYDNWYFSNNIKSKDFIEIRKILMEKAKNKDVNISNVNQFVNDKKRKKNKRAWESSLKHQISEKNLPEFDIAYDNLYPFIKNILNS